MEVQSLGKYLSDSKEWMLKFVAGEKRLSEVENPDTFKKHLKEKRSQWLEKPLHGISLKDKEKVTTERMWQWLKGRHLKNETKTMVWAAQGQALWVNSIKHYIGDQDVSPICRLCGKSSETVIHLRLPCVSPIEISNST